ncbi:AraC family transcriptional regulator [Paraburkholderia hospita]|uniref:AraC family transcriptional regulator n=1 Tax=Paraburkholderia hospita TaxID=169430 RepID=UPI0009DAFF88|nr:AraC family transcriptional regulator [Paraburkholderia hospita]OUL90258.1 AraC family transcriptional regulator [Paraburkholderia hospita]
MLHGQIDDNRLGEPILLPQDALSQLLLLHPVRTELDTRCRFNAPWRMAHPVAPSHVAPYHLVVEGTAMVDIDGHDTLALQPGDMLVFPRGHAHLLYTPDSDDRTPMYTMYRETPVVRLTNEAAGPATDILCGQFHFDPAGSRTLVDALPDIVLVCTADRTDFVGLQALVKLLRDETNEPRPGASAVVSHLASALLLMLLRAWLEQAHAVPGLFSLLADPKLNRALHEMLAEPGKAWTLEQLAQVCGMSRATFVRTFRAVAGTTPAELLLSIRMTQAAQWLNRTHRSIGDISEGVGYQSEAAFNRAFKRRYGIGPGLYRRGRNEDHSPLPPPQDEA